MFSTATAARAFAVAIDTQLAATDGEHATLVGQLDEILDAAHTAAGDVRAPLSSRKGAPEVWGMTIDAALAGSTDAIRAAYAANVEARTENRRRADALEQVHATHGQWNRFFLVVSSDGHIHRDTRCSSYVTTVYGWQPQLSGASEAEAVAALGPRMCTKCFPSAPAEWTVGVLPEGSCPGSRKAPANGTRRIGRSYYGECTSCGEQHPVATAGIRVHKLPYTADEAAAKKAATKAAGKVRAQEQIVQLANITLRSQRLENLRGYLADAGDRDPAYTASLTADIAKCEREVADQQAKKDAAERKLPALRAEADRLAALAPTR